MNSVGKLVGYGMIVAGGAGIITSGGMAAHELGIESAASAHAQEVLHPYGDDLFEAPQELWDRCLETGYEHLEPIQLEERQEVIYRCHAESKELIARYTDFRFDAIDARARKRTWFRGGGLASLVILAAGGNILREETKNRR